MKKTVKVKKITLLILTLIFALNVNAQNVNIPDVNFKNSLLGEPTINTNGDGEIQVSEAVAFSGAINVYFSNISDLTGIEAFTTLTGLYCGANQLTSLNVSSNTALGDLSCYNNQLTSLNIAANTALKYLHCWNNQLTSLDVSANTALKWLECHNNQLTSLDVSANTALTHFWCPNNLLNSLNVKNGNNNNFIYFDATNNANLTCIQVDNIAYMNVNWASYKDSTASYSQYCNITGIDNLSKDDETKIYPNPSSDIFTVDLNSCPDAKITVRDLLGNCLMKKDCQGKVCQQIDLSCQPKGIYSMEIESIYKKTVKKIVLQ